MATTKKITDLNKTTSVGNSDLLVLAKSGQQEAQSATVGAFVDKVATQISDGALIEHLAGLSKQKQILAKALTDKGVEGITEKSTLDEMANKIKGLDIVGSMEYIRPLIQEAYTSSSCPVQSPDTNGKGISLQYRDCMVVVNTTSKLISTVRLVGDDNGWTTLSQVTDSDLLGTVCWISPNKDHSAIAIATYGNSMAKILVYTVSEDGILAKKGVTINTAYTFFADSGTYSGMFLSPNADKVFVQNGTSSHTTMYSYSVEDGTQTKFTLNKYIAADYFVMLNETVFIGLYNPSTSFTIKRGSINYENLSISISETEISGGATLSYSFLPLPKDGLIAVWGREDSTNIFNRVFRIYEMESGLLCDSKKTKAIFLKNADSINPYSFSYYTSDNLMSFRYSNGRYKIYGAYTGIAEYDVNAKEVSFNNKTTIGGYFAPGAMLFMHDANFNYYYSAPLVTYVSEKGKMFGTGGGFSKNLSVMSDMRCCIFTEQSSTVGALLKRNGQEILLQVFNNEFYPSLMEKGAYAEKDSVEYLNLSEAEG